VPELSGRERRGSNSAARATDLMPDFVWSSNECGARAARLIHMYQKCILIHMRTTLILDDGLIERARELTGIREKTALVHAGLEALIAREAAKRLAALGGTEPKLRDVPRRRSA
jgi:Arc/MetJ family transcription regulator